MSDKNLESLLHTINENIEAIGKDVKEVQKSNAPMSSEIEKINKKFDNLENHQASFFPRTLYG